MSAVPKRPLNLITHSLITHGAAVISTVDLFFKTKHTRRGVQSESQYMYCSKMYIFLFLLYGCHLQKVQTIHPQSPSKQHIVIRFNLKMYAYCGISNPR